MLYQANCAVLGHVSTELLVARGFDSPVHRTLRQPARRADVAKSLFAVVACAGICERVFWGMTASAAHPVTPISQRS